MMNGDCAAEYSYPKTREAREAMGFAMIPVPLD